MTDSKDTRSSTDSQACSRRRSRPGLLALACLLAGWTLQSGAAPEDGSLPAPPDAAQTAPEGYWATDPESLPPSAWLDEVRAQRRAWEVRHRAVREDYEAHRQRSNPRGSARQEAWEEDLRRRRAERQEHIDREREMFRSLGELPAALPPSPGEPGANGGYRLPESKMFPPPGWNNLWYFRGF